MSAAGRPHLIQIGFCSQLCVVGGVDMKLGMQRAKWSRGLVHLIINGVHLTAVWVDVVDVYLIWEVSVAFASVEVVCIRRSTLALRMMTALYCCTLLAVDE